jgi:tetratricopeptide (TPR) repeat protein/4-amino-4-deoxy-L-arabinose transferase-like glycosyltransferase
MRSSDQLPQTEVEQNLGFASSLALFLFALGFRLVYIVQSTDNPLFSYPVVDAQVYLQWAHDMAGGNWLWNSVLNYTPIYPAFLALQQLIFGDGIWHIKLVQSAMGALAALLTAQTATRAWNRQAGLIAGYLLAANWMLVIFDSEAYAESFSIFCQSLTLWLLVHWTTRKRAIFLSGLVFALSAGVRANLFLGFPVIIGWLIHRFRRQRIEAIRAVLFFGAGTCVLIGPIVFRNYQLTGVPMLRTQATWSLYSGLDPQFEGLHPPTGILFQKFMRLPIQAGLHTEPEIEGYWGKRLEEVIGNNPLGVAANLLRRVLIFLNAREWSQEFDVYAYRAYSGFLSLPWPGFWLIGPLGFVGLFLCRPVDDRRGLLLLVALAGMLSILPFKASDRYRLPSAALLTVFAAVILWHMVGWMKAKNWRTFGTACAFLGLFGLICWPDWPDLAARKTARHDFFIGLMNEAHGSLDEAIPAYGDSMRKFPWDPDSPYRIGLILARMHSDESSRTYLEEALRREPQFPEAMDQLAALDLKAGDLRSAESLADSALGICPTCTQSLQVKAQILHNKGDDRGEVEFLTQATRNTKDPQLALTLAERLVALGRYPEALYWYDTVEGSPQVKKELRAKAAMLAGFTLARFFRDEKGARAHWQRVMRKYGELSFFSGQAEYLLGELNEAALRDQMAHSTAQRVSAEYVIGLKHWLKGDDSGAAAALRRCLSLAGDDELPEVQMPRQWAREDLERMTNDE